MATPSAQDPSVPPAAPKPSRRLPPPCWSHDETAALIDSYREKWYSLRRGNLRAPHWQEVADAVARRCPLSAPPKTSVQCRHKMEKLRKRYRTELQRALANPNHRFSSSWVHFKNMDSMEKGTSAGPVDSGTDGPDDDNDNDDDDEDLYGDSINNRTNNTRSLHRLMSNGFGGGSGGGGGFRIRIPGRPSLAPSGTGFRPKNYVKIEENPNPNPNFSSRVLKDGYLARSGLGKRGGVGEGKREGDPAAEMVLAIKMLGDGFVKIEQMKMDMAREIERMRMDMEMKRTEMILESQQRIVEAFAKGLTEKKKKLKRMPSPEGGL